MSIDLVSVAMAARPIFERVKLSLLPENGNKFVSIEPECGDCFIVTTLSEAMELARQKYPERLVHTFRLGHPATIHFGMQFR